MDPHRSTSIKTTMGNSGGQVVMKRLLSSNKQKDDDDVVTTDHKKQAQTKAPGTGRVGHKMKATHANSDDGDFVSTTFTSTSETASTTASEISTNAREEARSLALPKEQKSSEGQSRNGRVSSEGSRRTSGSLDLIAKMTQHAAIGPPDDAVRHHQPILATETNRMRTARKIAEFSQSSLDFSRISLIGREKEKRVLDRHFQQILKKPTSAVSLPSSSDEDNCMTSNDEESNASDMGSPKNKNIIGQHMKAQTITVRSLVSISGYSGTGKSALANTLRPKCKANDVFFVCGKFDLKQMDEPYSGFRTAMADLCSQICALPRSRVDTKHRGEEDARSFDMIRQRITDDLNIDELQSLNKLIPNLVDVVGNEALSYTNTQDNHGDGDGDESTVLSAGQPAQTTEGFKEQSIRLKFAFRRFIKIICSCCPLVWVSDDVQWADKESLNMIESWMLDTTISSLMVVICFRSNLVNMDGIDNGNASNAEGNARNAEGNVRNTIGTSNKRTSDLDSVATSNTADLVGQMLSSIQKKKRERFIRYVSLEVNNLSLDNVHTMLKQLLGIYSNDGDDRNSNSYGLAEIMFKKTDGNVFFVQQFIRMLVKDTLLSYDIASMKWVWDNDQIKRETPATINVVELMELKLQQIDTAQYLLPLAACLGSTFSWLLLRTALEGFAEDDGTGEDGHRALYESLFGGPPPASEDEWLDILKVYEEEGLIEAHTGSSTAMAASSPAVSEYSFIHDKVQEAALGMIPSKPHLLELQHRIGIILMDRLCPDDFESSLFVVANLLNGRLDMVPQYPTPKLTPTKGVDITPTRRFRVAKLNFDAGIKAASHAAFRAAYTYLQNAIDMMPPDHWQSHYDLSLQLFTSAAECAYVSNRFEMMQKYGNAVVERDDCPLIDKMRAYHVLMDGALIMVHLGKASDVMKLGAEVMAKLGYRYPKNSTVRMLTVIKRMMKLKKSIKKWTIEYLESMQQAADPMENLILMTITRHSLAAYLMDPGIQVLVTTDMINRSMVNGTTNFTVNAIGNLAVLVGSGLGDAKAAKTYAEYALSLCDGMKDSGVIVRTAMVSTALFLHNVTSFEDCKQALLDAYPIGMAGGHVQGALWCIVFYLDMCWFTGKLLHTLEADYSVYMNVATDFSQMNIVENVAARLQTILNLRGTSDHRTLLVGDAFDEIAAMQRAKQSGQVSLIMNIHRQKLFVGTYFGEFEDAAEVGLEFYDGQLKNSPGSCARIPSTFCTALAATIIYKRSKHLPRSKCNAIKQLARKAHAALRTAVEKKNPNAVHYLAILNAERAALKAHDVKHHGKRQESFENAVKMYQDAIRISARTGMTQDRALANERLAEHMLIENDRDRAKYHFDEAIRSYSEWGADGKVKQLHERCGSVWQRPAEITSTA